MNHERRRLIASVKECHMCRIRKERIRYGKCKKCVCRIHTRVRKLVKNLKGHSTCRESTTEANLFLLNFKLSTHFGVWENGSKGRIFNGHVHFFFFLRLVAPILPYNQHEHFHILRGECICDICKWVNSKRLMKQHTDIVMSICVQY